MERWHDVRRTLNSFTKVQLLNNVRKLAIFQPSYLHSDDDMEDLNGCTKSTLVETYIRELKKFATSSVVFGHLSLFYCYLHASQRIWTVYRLEGKSAQVDVLSRSPEELQEQLEIKLQRRYVVSSTFHLYDGAYWIRIAARSKYRRTLSISVMYIVHFSHSSCLGATAVKKTDGIPILKALGSLFKFQEACITALQDRHLYSLFQLFHEKEFPQVHFKRTLENPIAVVQPLTQSERVPDLRVHDCDQDDKKKREQYAEEQFGETDIPVITKLTYQLHTDFRGLQYAPKMAESKEPFNCKVVFEGPNVLEGFQQMVKCGVVTTPLPEYIANVRTLGKTKFLITSRNFEDAVDS